MPHDGTALHDLLRRWDFKSSVASSNGIISSDLHPGLLHSSSLIVESLEMAIPLSPQSLRELTLKLTSTKQKGKTKKMLADEEVNKVRVIEPYDVSFNDPSGTNTAVGDLWYDLLHENLIKGLASMSISQEFLLLPDKVSGTVHNSENYNTQLELSKCLFFSSKGVKQEVDGFKNVQEKARLASAGEQFFASFIVEVPLVGRLFLIFHYLLLRIYC